MSIELTNDEKIQVVEQHLRNIIYGEYNINLSIKENQSVAMPDQSSIDSLNLQLADLSAKKAALESELSKLQA
jgi:chaperonin cofactor prefoldin